MPLGRFKLLDFSLDEQKVPGWTGFYHQLLTPTHDDNHLCKMFYLPSIAQPPTKMSTAQEVLYQIKEKTEGLKNKEVDLVLDHASSFTILQSVGRNNGSQKVRAAQIKNNPDFTRSY